MKVLEIFVKTAEPSRLVLVDIPVNVFLDLLDRIVKQVNPTVVLTGLPKMWSYFLLFVISQSGNNLCSIFSALL